MLQPKRRKYTKEMKGRNRGLASANNTLSFGDYGIKSTQSGWVKANEIESARRAITGYIKRKGKVWIKIFPQKPITKKPNNMKMIGGKGSVEYYVACVKPGTMLFELSGVDDVTAKEALRLGSKKLSVMTKFVTKGGF